MEEKVFINGKRITPEMAKAADVKEEEQRAKALDMVRHLAAAFNLDITINE